MRWLAALLLLLAVAVPAWSFTLPFATQARPLPAGITINITMVSLCNASDCVPAPTCMAYSSGILNSITPGVC
jgi:hypothetical protein